MTDNFALIKDFIQSQWDGQFNSITDAFYSVELIGRKKDLSSVNAHKFKTYFIKNIEDLDKYEDEIKAVCDALKMRAYISVNSKSWRHITLNTMAEYADRISHDNFDKPQSVFESCVGKFVDKSNQLWIVDVDKEDTEKFNCTLDDLVFEYHEIICKCKPYKAAIRIIPTKSGKHIVCKPFNIVEFCDIYKSSEFFKGFSPDVESLIKKNNNTLLYENI